jgi:excisionase family DNA binding protein
MALKDKYLTITQAAERMLVSRQTISRWITEGKLSAEKVGREKLIPKHQIITLEKEQWAPVIAWRLLAVLREFLDYEPAKIRVRGMLGIGEPLYATVMTPEGKEEYIEIEEEENEAGSTTGFRCHKVDKFQPSRIQTAHPDTSVTVELDEQGRIVGTTVTDLKYKKKPKTVYDARVYEEE